MPGGKRIALLFGKQGLGRRGRVRDCQLEAVARSTESGAALPW